MAKYNIGGYIFEDENIAKKAAKELKLVEYILGQLKDADELAVLKVYKKLLVQKPFSTEIGMGFLNQLRANLVNTDAFNQADIPPVYELQESTVSVAEKEASSNEISEEPKEAKKTEKKSKFKSKKVDKVNEVAKNTPEDEVRRLRRINKLLLICVITLLLCVIGMFYINSTINSPTILNYKETITDEYSTWKQELDQREKELNEREAELNSRQ